MSQPSLARALVPIVIIQFLSWSAMFALWIFAVPVIAWRVLHVSPGDAGAFRQALIVVSACFAAYALLATILSFAQPRLIGRWGHGAVWGTGLLAGGAGLIMLGTLGVMALAPAFIAIAIGWSVMSSIPYALIGKLAPPGQGARLTRWFAFSTVVPQIVTTLGLAVFAESLFGTAVEHVVVLGGGAMMLGGALALGLRGRFAAADAMPDDW